MLSAALALPIHLSFDALPVTVSTQISTAFLNKYPGAKSVNGNAYKSPKRFL